jgi:hypothetical protein
MENERKSSGVYILVTLLCCNGLGENEPAWATAVKCPERL